jgi:hypothetical protein
MELTVVNLNINGTTHALDAPADMPLLWVEVANDTRSGS